MSITAAAIWNAYREIEVAEKLIADLEKERAEQKDGWGRPSQAEEYRTRIELSVPREDNSKRLYDVRPNLALAVIRAHIAEKKRELVEAQEKARLELEAAS